MAIRKNIETLQGVKVQDAYCRVENVSLRGKDTIHFVLRSYADTSKSSFQEVGFLSAYDLNGDNPIKQAYKHLKTLPEFAGTTDC
jgi:hypothetical protein